MSRIQNCKSCRHYEIHKPTGKGYCNDSQDKECVDETFKCCYWKGNYTKGRTKWDMPNKEEIEWLKTQKLIDNSGTLTINKCSIHATMPIKKAD